MRGQNTIVINGKVYDAHTGAAVGAPDPVKRPTATQAHKTPLTKNIDGVHNSNRGQKLTRKTQKSQTLRREHVKNPHANRAPVQQARLKRRSAHVERSAMISKFAPKNTTTPKTSVGVKHKTTEIADLPAREHHLVTKVKQQAPSQKANPKPKAKLSSQELKKQLINKRLAEADHHLKKPQSTINKRSWLQQPLKASRLASGALAIILLAGYLTYLNMPSISVRVAAAQANVNASYPSYQPDGYKLNGPVSYQPGKVMIRFNSNSGPQDFTITERSSNWNSQSLYDNYIASQPVNYNVTKHAGLTIYTHQNQAAWVNGGVFYTITGSAPLSTGQLTKLATSL